MTDPSFLLSTIIIIIIITIYFSANRVQSQLVYSIDEEIEIGHLIGNLLIDSQLDQRYSREVLRSLRFRFLSTPTVDFLLVDEISGNLLTTSRVDREAVCKNTPHHVYRVRRSQDARVLRLNKFNQDNDTEDNRSNCVVQVDVVVQPLEHFRIIRCSIRIKDINDNPPTFQPTHLVQELLESSQLGTGFVIPAARDLDQGRYGIAGYMLEVDDPKNEGMFGLKTLTKMDGSTEVRLVLMKNLDKETKDSHTFRVLAYDGGNPQRNGTLEVTVMVIDCNDNTPTFEQPLYEVRLTENSPVETVVLRILAHDADSGLNGEIVYGFAASTKTMYGNQFRVNPRSGEIKVIGSVDHEVSHVCHLIVTATDRGSPSLQSEVPVKLIIEDVNDNRPSIVINTLFQANTDAANVTENAEPGTFVGHVIGTDADSGSNGRFNCSLTGGEAVYDNDAGEDGGDNRHHHQKTEVGDPWKSRRVEHFRLRRMFNGEYNIITSTPIDREALAHLKNCHQKDEDEICFQLTIVCQDHGTPSLRSDKPLQVLVTDSNDNAPIFSKNVYRFEIFENSPIGFPFASVHATDTDGGDNGRIAYSLVPSNKVGSGKSSNLEGGNNNNKTDGTIMFNIDPSSGELSPSRIVDHEIIKSVTMQVVANDYGIPKLSTVATIHLKILDVNDQPPIFTSGLFRFRLEENKPKNSEVGRVTAVDRDFPPYNKFHFQLSLSDVDADDLFASHDESSTFNQSANKIQFKTPQHRHQQHHHSVTESSFMIDQESGIIKTLHSLDREMIAQHFLLVSVIDSNDPKLFSTATVLVFVDDINDNPPKFVYPSTPTSTFIHSEPLLKGRTFVSLSARDPDLDRNGEIRYFINKVIELNAINQHSNIGEKEKHKTTESDFGDNTKTITKTSTTTITTTTTTTTTAVVNKSRRKETVAHPCDDERQISGELSEGKQQFIIDSRTGRLTANEDFYITVLKTTASTDILQNRTFAIEVLARDCGQPRYMESKTTLNLVIVKRVGSDLRSSSLESGFLSGSSYFFYGNIALTEESLSWTLVLCIVTAFIVIILLTAIALVGCRGDEKKIQGATVGIVRTHASSAATYTTDGFRTALLNKHKVRNSEEKSRNNVCSGRFFCWKSLFRNCRFIRNHSA